MAEAAVPKLVQPEPVPALAQVERTARTMWGSMNERQYPENGTPPKLIADG